MRVLYLQNVPDEVIEWLERLARRENTSVSAVAVRELADASRRVDIDALLGDLPDLKVATTELVGNLETERSGRWTLSTHTRPSPRC